MYKKNSSSAAVAAVLIIIIIIAVGTAVMIVTGRSRILDNDNLPVIADSVIEESSLSESVPDLGNIDSQIDSTAEPVALMTYPEKSADYKDINNKDFTADYAVLIDSDNNTIIAGKNSSKKMYPASLTKIMSMIVAAENVESLDDTYTFTADDIDPLVEENASRAGFEAGEKVTIKDMMYASILVSGADGTTGISNFVAGSEKAFVELMNAKAEELGLKNTHFENASGLHNKNHYSTCEDMAMILKYAMENDICREILTAKTYTTSKTSQHKDGIELTSILAMRLDGYYVDGGGEITGGKTGFTNEAKFTLATFLEYNNKNYICVTCKSDGEFIAMEDNIMVYEKYLTKSGKTNTDSAPEADSENSSLAS